MIVKRATTSAVKIKFAFYEEAPFSAEDPFYRVVQGDGKGLWKGMIVGAEEIAAAGFPIPITPTLDTWRSMTGSKRRCRRCWTPLRGTTADFIHHLSTAACGRNDGR